MKKLPLWLWVILALIAADLLLVATGTGILIRQQRGHGWAMEGNSVDVSKRKIPLLACTYWTGTGTRLIAHPLPQPGQGCPFIAG